MTVDWCNNKLDGVAQVHFYADIWKGSWLHLTLAVQQHSTKDKLPVWWATVKRSAAAAAETKKERNPPIK